jgi:hypothetical protein
MPTISELKAAHDGSGKRPEELRMRRMGWPDTDWYCPMFLASHKWYGFNADKCLSIWCDSNEDNWHLWQEPKTRKVVWQWAVANNGRLHTPDTWFSEIEIMDAYPSSNFYHKLLPGRDAETGEVVE